MKARFVAGLLGVAVLVLLLRRDHAATPEEAYHVAMGTVVRVALYVEPDRAQPLFEGAWAEIDRLDSMLSSHGASSEVTAVNLAPPAQATRVSPELEHVLGRSLALARRTQGAFDPALGALTTLWGFPEVVRPPSAAAVDSARHSGGYRLVDLRDGRVSFARPGVQLDLGAAAKGYVVDRAVERLRAGGATAGVVEAGGDLRFWGRKPDGRPWRFGVQHPRDAARVVEVDDVGLPALATSGDYEQAFEFEGRRYHHLLDPATGYPAVNAVSATVWAPTALRADALATAAFVAGPQRALEWAAGDDSLEVLLYYEAGGVLRRAHSAGLAGRLEAAADTEPVTR